jgi:hypothetical protein
MAAYVYILVHKDKPRFKIGKALDIAARVAQLTYDELDFTRSRALEVQDEAAAFNLERALHRCFDKWRMSAEDIVSQEGERFAGYTEWFRTECFDRLMSFVDQNAELFDYKLLSSAQLQTKMKPANSDKPKAAYVSRPRVKRGITPEDIAGAKAQAHLMQPLLESLLEQCDSAEVIPYGSGWRALAGVCKIAHAETVRDLIEELLDQGRYKYSLGFFAIFSGATLVSTEETLQFKVNHIWPHDDAQESGPARAAAQVLSELPIHLAGWSL